MHIPEDLISCGIARLHIQDIMLSVVLYEIIGFKYIFFVS